MYVNRQSIFITFQFSEFEYSVCLFERVEQTDRQGSTVRLGTHFKVTFFDLYQLNCLAVARNRRDWTVSGRKHVR